MLAPIWRPAGKRTNVSDTENKKRAQLNFSLRWQLCPPSASLTPTTWRSTSTSTSRSSRGTATRPATPGSQHMKLLLVTSAGAPDIDRAKKTLQYRCGYGEKDLLNTSLESGNSGEHSTAGGNSLSRWERNSKIVAGIPNQLWMMVNVFLKCKLAFISLPSLNNVGWDGSAVKCLECEWVDFS